MRQMLLGFIALALTSCAEQHNTWQQLQGQGFQAKGEELFLSTDQTIQVVDHLGLPIGAAEIMIGLKPGDPFSGNIVKSDQNGLAKIPANWKSALPVTISAKGFITKTIPTSLPEPRVIQLNIQESNNRFEVKGDTTDFGRLIQDGKVDFAMVMPALNRMQLINFDLSMVLSAEFDTIELPTTDVQIPSNITLPLQTETYVFPIEFNKPQYRHILRNTGSYKFFASHGQFPIQKVVGDIRAGKSIYDVINYFNFLGGGYRTTDVNGNLAGQHIPVNQIKFDTTLPVKAPTFNSDQMIFSLSLAEQDGLMTPFDLKRLKSNTVTKLKSAGNQGSPYVISLMMKNNQATANPVIDWTRLPNLPLDLPIRINPLADQDFSQLTFNIEPSTTSEVLPTFIDPIAKPRVSADSIVMATPPLPNHLEAIATYAVYSEIETTGSGEFKNERRTRLWEMLSESWVNQFDLPKVSFPKNPNRTYRWEVMFLAAPKGSSPAPLPNGELDFNIISHVSRNATNL